VTVLRQVEVAIANGEALPGTPPDLGHDFGFAGWTTRPTRRIP